MRSLCRKTGAIGRLKSKTKENKTLVPRTGPDVARSVFDQVTVHGKSVTCAARNTGITPTAAHKLLITFFERSMEDSFLRGYREGRLSG
jgi:hypothetical protein